MPSHPRSGKTVQKGLAGGARRGKRPPATVTRKTPQKAPPPPPESDDEDPLLAVDSPISSPPPAIPKKRSVIAKGKAPRLGLSRPSSSSRKRSIEHVEGADDDFMIQPPSSKLKKDSATPATTATIKDRPRVSGKATPKATASSSKAPSKGRGKGKGKSVTVIHEETASVEDPALLYCLCQKPYDGHELMIMCDGCQEWYHGRCVGLTEEEASGDGRFDCPDCLKKAKPKGKSPAALKRFMENRGRGKKPPSEVQSSSPNPPSMGKRPKKAPPSPPPPPPPSSSSSSSTPAPSKGRGKAPPSHIIPTMSKGRGKAPPASVKSKRGAGKGLKGIKDSTPKKVSFPTDPSVIIPSLPPLPITSALSGKPSSLNEGEEGDDEEDICPICDAECTCQGGGGGGGGGEDSTLPISTTALPESSIPTRGKGPMTAKKPRKVHASPPDPSSPVPLKSKQRGKAPPSSSSKSTTTTTTTTSSSPSSSSSSSFPTKSSPGRVKSSTPNGKRRKRQRQKLTTDQHHLLSSDDPLPPLSSSPSLHPDEEGVESMEGPGSPLPPHTYDDENPTQDEVSSTTATTTGGGWYVGRSGEDLETDLSSVSSLSLSDFEGHSFELEEEAYLIQTAGDLQEDSLGDSTADEVNSQRPFSPHHLPKHSGSFHYPSSPHSPSMEGEEDDGVEEDDESLYGGGITDAEDLLEEQEEEEARRRLQDTTDQDRLSLSPHSSTFPNLEVLQFEEDDIGYHEEGEDEEEEEGEEGEGEEYEEDDVAMYEAAFEEDENDLTLLGIHGRGWSSASEIEDEDEPLRDVMEQETEEDSDPTDIPHDPTLPHSSTSATTPSLLPDMIMGGFHQREREFQTAETLLYSGASLAKLAASSSSNPGFPSSLHSSHSSSHPSHTSSPDESGHQSDSSVERYFDQLLERPRLPISSISSPPSPSLGPSSLSSLSPIPIITTSATTTTTTSDSESMALDHPHHLHHQEDLLLPDAAGRLAVAVVAAAAAVSFPSLSEMIIASQASPDSSSDAQIEGISPSSPSSPSSSSFQILPNPDSSSLLHMAMQRTGPRDRSGTGRQAVEEEGEESRMSRSCTSTPFPLSHHVTILSREGEREEGKGTPTLSSMVDDSNQERPHRSLPGSQSPGGKRGDQDLIDGRCLSEPLASSSSSSSTHLHGGRMEAAISSHDLEQALLSVMARDRASLGAMYSGRRDDRGMGELSETEGEEEEESRPLEMDELLVADILVQGSLTSPRLTSTSSSATSSALTTLSTNPSSSGSSSRSPRARQDSTTSFGPSTLRLPPPSKTASARSSRSTRKRNSKLPLQSEHENNPPLSSNDLSSSSSHLHSPSPTEEPALESDESDEEEEEDWAGEERKEMQSLSRWDRLPIGAFRRSRGRPNVHEAHALVGAVRWPGGLSATTTTATTSTPPTTIVVGDTPRPRQASPSTSVHSLSHPHSHHHHHLGWGLPHPTTHLDHHLHPRRTGEEDGSGGKGSGGSVGHDKELPSSLVASPLLGPEA